MRAPRDRRMLEDFQKALRQDAAFVPADLDRRPGTMRVVYSVHRVDVHDRNYSADPCQKPDRQGGPRTQLVLPGARAPDTTPRQPRLDHYLSPPPPHDPSSPPV